jgi:aminoglycoside phosphotransferase
MRRSHRVVDWTGRALLGSGQSKESVMEHLLAYDAAVPSRDRLLDINGMRRHLPAMSPGRCEVIEALRIKYRPFESLRVVYRIDGGAILTARTFAPFQLAAAARHGQADFAVPELSAAFWTFPRDRRLGGLEYFLRPDAALRAQVPGWVASTLAGYAPEKCAVIACLDNDGRPLAFAKVFADQATADCVRALYARLAASIGRRNAFDVPGIIAERTDRRALWFAPASGTRAADLPAADLSDALRRIGRAVGHVHAAPAGDEIRAANRHTPDALHEAARLVGRAQPRLQHSVLLLAADLASRRTREDAVLLHGDLHLKNAFVDGDRVSLIDFDQAARGPAAVDLGGLLAALHGADPSLGSALLAGYAEVLALPSANSLAWHTAASLLTERAVRAITRVRLPTLRTLDHLIDDARALAQKARRAR